LLGNGSSSSSKTRNQIIIRTHPGTCFDFTIEVEQFIGVFLMCGGCFFVVRQELKPQSETYSSQADKYATYHVGFLINKMGTEASAQDV